MEKEQKGIFPFPPHKPDPHHLYFWISAITTQVNNSNPTFMLQLKWFLQSVF